jgi:hypothetical protein
MLAERGIVKNDADKRIIVLGNDLRWAGGPSTPQSRATDGLMKLEDFLNKGKLDQEEKFEGSMANETVYLCYSSVRTFLVMFLNFWPISACRRVRRESPRRAPLLSCAPK